MKGSPTIAYTYRVCTLYDHVYSKHFIQGNLNLVTECQLNIDYISVNYGHQESPQPFIVDCMFRPPETPDMQLTPDWAIHLVVLYIYM